VREPVSQMRKVSLHQGTDFARNEMCAEWSARGFCG
jgi:hypothetical protein